MNSEYDLCNVDSGVSSGVDSGDNIVRVNIREIRQDLLDLPNEININLNVVEGDGVVCNRYCVDFINKKLHHLSAAKVADLPHIFPKSAIFNLSTIVQGKKLNIFNDINSFRDVYLINVLRSKLNDDRIDYSPAVRHLHNFLYSSYVNPEYIPLIIDELTYRERFVELYRLADKNETLVSEGELIIPNEPDINKEDYLYKVHELLGDVNGLIIDPFSQMIQDLRYSPLSPTFDVIDILNVNNFELLQKIFVNSNVFKSNLNKITHNVFISPFNSNVNFNFPWKNVVYSGGSVLKLLTGQMDNIHTSDIDLFIVGHGNKEKYLVLKDLLDWFDTPETFYTLRGGVITIMIKNINCKFQIICSSAKEKEDVIKSFDMTHIRWWYNDGKVYGSLASLVAAITQTTDIRSYHNLKTHRVVKALYHGYKIKKSVEIDEQCGQIIIDIADQRKEDYINEIIQNNLKWYFPMDVVGMKLSDNHHMAMIKLIADASIVTMNKSLVFKNIIIDYDFVDYKSNSSYVNFKPDLIKYLGNVDKECLLRHNHSYIKLRSDICEIISVDYDKHTITTKNEDKFIEFCDSLIKLFKRYHDAVDESNHIDDKVTVYFNQNGLEYLKIQSQVGHELSFEDLHDGDRVQYMFYVVTKQKIGERVIRIQPYKIVKFIDIE